MCGVDPFTDVLTANAEYAKTFVDDGRPGVAGSGPSGARATARLHYAYADALLVAGEDAEARSWFASAAELDTVQETDAVERRDALDGLLIEFDESEDPDQPGDSATSPSRTTIVRVSVGSPSRCSTTASAGRSKYR